MMRQVEPIIVDPNWMTLERSFVQALPVAWEQMQTRVYVRAKALDIDDPGACGMGLEDGDGPDVELTPSRIEAKEGTVLGG